MPHGYYGRGLVYVVQKNYDPAIADLTKVIEIAPTLSKGFTPLALDYFKQMTLNAYNYRASAYFNQAKYELALADINKVIELDRTNPARYNIRAKVYRALGKDDLAETDEQNEMFYQAKLYSQNRQYDAAIAAYTKMLEKNPADARAYHGRGGAYFYMKQYDSAIADYSKVIEIDPRTEDIFSHRALAYAEQGKYEPAIADYTKAIEISPENGAIYSFRADAYRKIGKNDLADADKAKARALWSK